MSGAFLVVSKALEMDFDSKMSKLGSLFNVAPINRSKGDGDNDLPLESQDFD